MTVQKSSEPSNPLVNSSAGCCISIADKPPQVVDPPTHGRGAGAGPNVDGAKQAARNLKEAAGVIEARPGIIETTNIDPLNHDPNKGQFVHSGGAFLLNGFLLSDDWANTTMQPQAARTTEGFVSTATTKVSEATNKAYEKATGHPK